MGRGVAEPVQVYMDPDTVSGDDIQPVAGGGEECG